MQQANDAPPLQTSAGKQRPDLNGLRPSEFMRARHPHLFSDTEISERAHLDRAVLDHHLETLTSRKEELVFERFARRLAEKEICPNLVPQTGPTGGGDSKVDTETYPVAEEIAARWYEANAQPAATERWAFAFSTKKAWKPKLKSDLASIAGTQRGYTRVYFLSSRYVPDKERGELQDALRQQYGFAVHILDRTWILEKIFANHREELTIETLDLERPLAPKVKKGPRDTRREAELEELERQIADLDRYKGIEYQLVEDCLEATLLARSLERPRIEIEGRFERAIRIAERHGTRQQQLRIVYNRAWTLYWWYEDYPAFLSVYGDVESLATGRPQVSDVELLKNLWQLLYTAAAEKHISTEQARFNERTAVLREELQRFRDDATRPNAALEAWAHQVFMNMVLSFGDKDRLSAALAELKDIFEISKGLVEFPARALIDLLMELGEAFPQSDLFDELFEVAVPIAQERDSSATAGLMLLRRGAQKFDAGQPYEAIRLLGRAQQRLTLRECREDFVGALALCARAYERAGLFWAARASMLLAASQALKEFWTEGTVTRQAYSCLCGLAWIEMQLGRIPFILSFIESLGLYGHAVRLDAAEREVMAEEWVHIDFVLGVLLLKTDFFDLKYTTRLPAVLKRLRLDFAWSALLYLLGHEDRLRAGQVFSDVETAEDIHAGFTGALKKVDDGDLAAAPQFLNGRKLELHSCVLGCEVVVELPNENRPRFLTEAILAALESFLATSLDADLLPYTPKFRVKIIPVDYQSAPFEWTILADQHVIELRYSTDPNVDLDKTQDLIVELVVAITLQLALPADRTYFEGLVRDEQAMGRAMMLTRSGLAVGNVLGDRLRLRLDDWEVGDAEEFPVRRRESWLVRSTTDESKKSDRPLIFGAGDPPAEMLNTEALKHRDRKVISLINIPLWDRANWRGAGFVVYEEPRIPPILALVFKDRDAGVSIFSEWRDEIGAKDETGRLRVSIITGIDRRHPSHYRVIVGTNDGWKTARAGFHVVMVSRVLTVTPTSSENLDRFLRAFTERGKYLLAAGHARGKEPEPDVAFGLAVLCSQLNVRPAWEIPEHDPDVIGIHLGDDVVIPEGVKDPPIFRTLEMIRKRRKRDVMPKKQTAAGTAPKIGRNDPCHCGSGKKWKKCHGK